jgi:OOP family OmpA-OmpF porin
MIKKISILLIIGFAPLLLRGQNLITNGSFEELNTCPPNPSFPLNVIPGWYSPSWNTPDIFNACVTTQNLGDVPYTGAGYQYAKEGIGFGGGVQFFFNREYITNRLVDTLKSSKTYCLIFYINLGDNQFDAIAIDRIGVYFSNDSIYYNTYFELPVTPQLETEEGVFYNDTSGWTKVELQYLAHGGEQYMTIGNFRPDSLTHSQQLDTLAYQGYYFFDDFSLIECKGNAIDENPALKAIHIYPNPAFNSFNIQYNSTIVNTVFELYSIDGKKLDSVQLQGQSGLYTYSTDNLADGVYLYVLKGANGKIASGKLVLIK